MLHKLIELIINTIKYKKYLIYPGFSPSLCRGGFLDEFGDDLVGFEFKNRNGPDRKIREVNIPRGSVAYWRLSAHEF